MHNMTTPAKYLSADQRRLLGGWRHLEDDIRLLCRALVALPDDCQCANGRDHLQGRCPCCHSVATNRVPACEDCDAQLASLRPAIDALAVDSQRFFPALRDVLTHASIPTTVDTEHAIERHLAGVIHSFNQLVVAADIFSTDCRSSHLKTVKDAARALLEEAEQLDRTL